MKSKHRGWPERRPPEPLKPEERAGLYRAALQYRAALRAEAAGEVREAAARTRRKTDGDRDPRAVFAAAVARAEFGRFYWRADPAQPRPLRNGQPRPTGRG